MSIDELQDELEKIWAIGSDALEVLDDYYGIVPIVDMMTAIEKLIVKIDNLNVIKVTIK